MPAAVLAVRPRAIARARAVPAGWRMWGLGAALYVVALFHRMSLGVAALEASRRLGVGAGLISALSVIQLGLYLAMQVPAGLLADRVGPRRALTAGLLAMGAGQLLFAFSTSLTPALAGRALIGLGDACMFVNILRLAAHWLPRRRYPLAAALTGLCGAAGQLLTTVPLNAALGAAGWTATFAGAGALTLVLAGVAAARLRDRPAAAPSPVHASSPLADHHAPRPAREPLLATLRRTWQLGATRHGACVHFALLGPFVALTGLWAFPYLVQGEGLSHGAASLLLLGAVLTNAAALPVVGVVAGRRPHDRARLAAVVAAVGAAALAVLELWPGGTPPVEVLGLALAALGVAAATSVLGFDIAREEDHDAGGSASGLVNIGGYGAAVSGQLAVGALLALGAGATPAETYRIALLPLLAIGALGAVAAARKARLTPVSAARRGAARGAPSARR